MRASRAFGDHSAAKGDSAGLIVVGLHLRLNILLTLLGNVRGLANNFQAVTKRQRQRLDRTQG